MSDGRGVSSGKSIFHVDRAESLSGYGVEVASSRLRLHRSADAKKAEVVRWEARLIPRPPELTGSVACSHAISSDLKSMLVILETIDMTMLSQDAKWGEEKGGEVRNTCNS